MKKITLLTLLWLTALSAFAQHPNPYPNYPMIKKIEVQGSAEMEVIPDEIYLRVALKEYKADTKKVNMDKLEAQLVKAIEQLGLPKENLQVENIYGYNWDWRKKKSDEFLATKSFRLKLKDVKMINNLVEKLDPEGVNSMNIAEVSHSKIKELRNDLKLQALKAAKEKAKYLLDGIGEKLGSALEIQDIDYGDQYPMYERATMSYAKGSAQDESYQSDLEYKTIKLKSQIRAVFEID
ncbi:hypothetical protein C900_02498 [Fulvivirga imtechensis AK7]|uniref:Outer membrane protein n=1 Tax=Fulvivirga imtechensis AK7 TaxID=1237149 RepID=L8JTL3_9BACT|nr:SIMPL domain-containing protein [Fulvivirga imtechensis]ELR71583.1 hypothetical protein C900_02498 [Fulvivirga imtechensis AK7]